MIDYINSPLKRFWAEKKQSFNVMTNQIGSKSKINSVNLINIMKMNFIFYRLAIFLLYRKKIISQKVVSHQTTKVLDFDNTFLQSDLGKSNFWRRDCCGYLSSIPVPYSLTRMIRKSGKHLHQKMFTWYTTFGRNFSRIESRQPV